MTGQDPIEDGVSLAATALGVGRAEAARWLEDLGGLAGLRASEPAGWCRVRGVGPSLARRLHAAARLGAATVRVPQVVVPVVDGPESALAVLAPALRGLAHEELHALYLDRRQRVLAHRRLTVGSDRYTVVDPPQVFRPAVALGAAAVVLAHNHPSGDPTPSAQDHEVTARVARAGEVLGVSLHDHLVIAGQGFTSLARTGRLGRNRPVAAAWTA